MTGTMNTKQFTLFAVLRLIIPAILLSILVAGLGCNAVGRVVTARVEIRAGTNRVVVTQPKDTLIGELSYDPARGVLVLRDYKSSSKVEAIEAARLAAEAQSRSVQAIAGAFDSGFRAAAGAFGVRIPDRGGDSGASTALGSPAPTPSPAPPSVAPSTAPPSPASGSSGSKLVPFTIPGAPGTFYRIAPADDASAPALLFPTNLSTSVPVPFPGSDVLILTNGASLFEGSLIFDASKVDSRRWFEGDVIPGEKLTNDLAVMEGGTGGGGE